MDERALQLIDRIYAAAWTPTCGSEVTEGSARSSTDSPTMLSFVIPGERRARATRWA
jgi:hypothetical protein